MTIGVIPDLRRLTSLALTLLSLISFGQDKSVYSRPYLPDSLLPRAFTDKLNFIRNDFEDAFRFRPGGMKIKDDVRKYTLPEVLDIIDREQDFEMLFRAQFWCALDSNYKTALPALIDKITDTTLVGLTNAGDVIVWERVFTGELDDNPMSYIIKDDIFRVAGRANWILQRLTGITYGRVRIKNDTGYLLAMQKEWLKWLKTLKEK